MAMIEKINKDGSLDNFRVDVTDYISLTGLSDILVFSIPVDDKYQQFKNFSSLTSQTIRVRKLVKWTGIPLLLLWLGEFIMIIIYTATIK